MSQFVSDRAYDYFDLGEESDQESAESSEDEIDIILHGTPEQRRRLRHMQQREQPQGATPQRSRQQLKQREDQPSSSEDEFEKEMNAELNTTVQQLEKSRGKKQLESGSSNQQPNTLPPSTGTASGSKKSFYDNIYFDSDDEDNFEGTEQARVPRQHAQLSNDDLLYDPEMDDDDQKWMDKRRRQYHNQGNASTTPGSSAAEKRRKQVAPKSDAILDCPACMTTLCIDCQRHDTYSNQYRAMFVMNCKVNTSEMLSVPEQAPKKKSKKSKKKAESSSSEGTSAGSSEQNSIKDQFHPVLCEECDTVVGVIDSDEVYHFFNVLSSRS